MTRRRTSLPSRRSWILCGLFIGTVFAVLAPMVRLVADTSDLSQAKIRRLFALDAAASMEMSVYADFLNRSAHVNGAFPQTIFSEGFLDTCIERKDGKRGDCGPKGDSLYGILYRNGAFPQVPGGKGTAADPGGSVWPLRFGGAGKGKNGNPPATGRVLDLVSMQNALDYWLSWDDAQEVYKLYVEIYSLLGATADGQRRLFDRLRRGHGLFRKGYWLNSGDAPSAADEAAKGFDAGPFSPRPYCASAIQIYGNKATGSPFQPYRIWAPNEPIQLGPTAAGCLPGPGLFQAEAVPDADLARLRAGLPLLQHWTAPENSFGVDMNREADCAAAPAGRPCVRVTAALVGGRLWPDPTPKFQTKVSP